MNLANLDDNVEIAIVKSKKAFFNAVRDYAKEQSLMFVSDNVGINDGDGYPLLVFFNNDVDNKTFDTNEVSLSTVLKLF
jgi:hypothetical protein